MKGDYTYCFSTDTRAFKEEFCPGVFQQAAGPQCKPGFGSIRFCAGERGAAGTQTARARSAVGRLSPAYVRGFSHFCGLHNLRRTLLSGGERRRLSAAPGVVDELLSMAAWITHVPNFGDRSTFLMSITNRWTVVWVAAGCFFAIGLSSTPPRLLLAIEAMPLNLTGESSL